MKEIVQEIHKSNKKAVIAITGGGVDALGTLLRYGGGSATLIEATVPYDMKSFQEYVRGIPDKYCSEDAAAELAAASYQRGLEFEDPDVVIGVGCTCSLAKEGERKGRSHRGYIAFQSIGKTQINKYEFKIDSSSKVGTAARETEEHYIAEQIIKKLAAFICYLDPSIAINMEAETEVAEEYAKVLGVKISKEEKTYSSENDEEKLMAGTADFIHVKTKNNESPKIILSGSFNPPHAGHAFVSELVSEKYGEKVDWELCIKNADKPALSYKALHDRKEFVKEYEDKNWMGNLIFSRASTFVDKSKVFPNCKFIVGFDTLKRIADPKYYEKDGLIKAIKTIKSNGCSFVMFHRNSTPDDYEKMPQELKDITEIMPWESPNISSSEIRAKQ